MRDFNEPHSDPARMSSFEDGLWAQRWLVSVSVGVVLAFTAGIFTVSTFVPRFRANHLLEENVDFVLLPDQPQPPKNVAEHHRPLIFSPQVLTPVLESEPLRSTPSLADAETAERNLRENLSVTTAGSNSRMIVSYVDTDPIAAAEICNAVVASFLSVSTSIDNRRNIELERWIAPEIERWEQEMEEKQRRIVELSKQVHGYNPNDTLGRARRESDVESLKILRVKISETKIELALLRAHLDQNDPAEPESSQPIDPAERELVTELEVLQKEYDRRVESLEEAGSFGAELQFANDDLKIAREVLLKLRDRVAAIRTERRRDAMLRSVAPAMPPSVPTESLTRRLMLVTGATFLSTTLLALMISTRIGRSRTVAPDQIA